MGGELTRRELVASGIGAGVGLAGLGWASGLQSALAAPARAGALHDIEHVVIFVQENRSFDHYFGTYRGVRGFGDPNAQRLHDGSGLPVFAQPGYPAKGYGGHLYPFHLVREQGGECTHDVTHDWGPQHRSWNRGRMDGFVREHLKAEGPGDGPLTMGYFKRDDIPYYHALADAFTICDRYHCSVIGPTDPNQLYVVSGTLDPAGKHGGPLLETLSNRVGQYSWTTMPEQLRARGISWKAYASSDNYGPTGDMPFPLFKQFHEDPELAAGAFSNDFPSRFEADCASGDLPQVSWVWGQITHSEHPPAPVSFGEFTTDLILKALTGNPELWAKTALFVTWDENGGFFDHLPPPVAPPGTAGEYVTVRPLPAAAQGVAGPIGLGFRVPALVISPFSRGGFVCSHRFDHTSLLRFVERRFGAEVPNLSDWRRSVTGDMTAAFGFGVAPPDPSVPDLPPTSASNPDVVNEGCVTGPGGIFGAPTSEYPVPPNHGVPKQQPGKPRRRPGRGRPHRVRDERHRRHRH
ncbi:MAG: phospholipase [Thermoleophilaceae bacterium]|nr:phospholipase [Thermoleophilaceae bacterium]